MLALSGDCTDEATVVELFRRIYAEAGFVDILMNNVGQSARERASEFYKSEPEVWRFVIDVTLMATLLASRQVVPAMREAGGASSTWRRTPAWRARSASATTPPPRWA